MITEGLGDLDRAGIAELTFKDRHKHSGGRIYRIGVCRTGHPTIWQGGGLSLA